MPETHGQYARQQPRTALVKPKVNPSLLAAVPAPVCTYSDTPSVKVEAAPVAESGDSNSAEVQKVSATSGSITTLEHAQRRERERDCFRDAEVRVRKKLSQLQASVRSIRQYAERERDAALP